MRPILPLFPTLAIIAVGGPGLAQDEPAAADPAAEQTDAAPDQAALIAQAESAGPAAVAAGATIHGFDETGQMVTLREGTNGWWCMPDDPVSPAVDPMCGDANSMEWVMAWIGKTEPPAGKPGFIYMLQEGSDSSNTDPYAQGPTDENDWIHTGPHVMIMNSPDMLASYPAEPVPAPDTSQPYVMWAGTPYAHLMIPVE
jgi:hypothetical protein